MRKTGWDPPPLMQDDNAQLSRWFASRPDARYVFIRNQRRKKMMYVVRNHNHTVLGVFDNEHDAEKDAKEYRDQTGNPAYVDKEHEDDDTMGKV
jgi:hypothetical protein